MFDRRISNRYSLHWQIEVHGNDRLGMPFHEIGFVEDLSSSGAFFYLNHPVDLGAKISLSIKLPVETESWMIYTAQVIRVKGNDAKAVEGNEPQKIGIGIRFDSFKPQFVN